MLSNAKIKDIELILSHPHGQIEISGEKWVLTGPGEKDLLRPIAAKSKTTGEVLPITVIPLRYRNNRWSRLLIKLGLLSDPWKSNPHLVFKDHPES